MVVIQDIKSRLVYWFCFPLIAVCAGALMYQQTTFNQFLWGLGINLLFVSLLIVVVYVYSKLKIKSNIQDTFGLGDALLFFGLAFSFMSVSFIVLFVFGLIFSLVMHLVIKSKLKQDTVPLAGYLSLFFALAYLAYWFGILNSVYSI